MGDVSSLADALLQYGYTQGVAVALVQGSDTQVLGFGRVSSPNGRKPDANTVFEIGSVTKVFTALALAEMVEQGMVKLDDPVGRYLPDSVKMPHFQDRQITLLDLAAHVSGLPRMPANFAPENPSNPYLDYDAEKLYAYLSSCELTRSPGVQAEYSNLGTALLGHALSRRANESYEALIMGRVCRPLGMKDTSITLSPDQKARFSQGHTIEGDPVPAWDFSVMAGAGGFHSTVEDLVLFLKVGMGLTESSLSGAMRASLIPRSTSDVEGWKVGLAWQVSPDGQTAWHNGGTYGYYSFVGFNKERQFGIVWLCNSALWQVPEINGRLLDLLAGKPLDPLLLKSSVPLDPGILDAYTGEYLAPSDTVLKVFRDGHRLVFEAPTGDKAILHAQSGDRFFFRETPGIEVRFERDESGKTSGMTFNGKDGSRSAKKIK